MASLRPKSPRPGNVSGRPEKEESFWEKIGTLGRKKRIKEGEEPLISSAALSVLSKSARSSLPSPYLEMISLDLCTDVGGALSI